ncbi:hypothetical protein BTR22_01895 [Alkalihalophilus pseudofirmus]|uniref:hypothetical protein n=1 Tax=Alkalihalophilus pseudofirmus TaxID=79885 RepID=UPI00095177E9|nr:hypothetical protein BTR22_01895 [Alkalihalophilus pseudofirmus]
MERDKRTISIRLNNKEQEYKEHEYDLHEEEQEYKSQDRVFNEAKEEITAARDERYDEELEDAPIPKPDNVIDFTERQTEREKGKGPFWDDGNRESGPKLPVNRKKKSQRSFTFSIPSLPNFSSLKSFSLIPIAIILSAIIVGVSFGVVVLNVFTGGGENAAVSEPIQQASPEAAPTFQAIDGGLPSLSVEVIQGGAFSTVEKGQEMVSVFQNSGLAAVLTDTTDPLYLFVGLGADRGDTTSLAAILENEGKETYLKSYQVSGEGLAAASESSAAWYTDALSIFNSMLTLTTNSLAKGSGISDADIQAVTKELTALHEGREEALAEIPEAAQASTLLLGNELDSSLGHLAGFMNSNDQKELWKAQQSLLRVLLAYEQVVEFY